MLIDSYWKERDGKVTLSGKSEGITGLGAKLLAEAGKGGSADVVFLPTDVQAEKLVKDCFDIEHSHNPEGYVIDIDDTITVYADTDGAKLFAVHAILGHNEGGIQKGVRYHYPMVEHRSARVYLPPKKDLNYFKQFIDMLPYLGYNTLLLEIGGAMEWKRHPEINEVWQQYCESMKEFNNKCYRGSSIYYRLKTTAHIFNGEGDIYSQEEMKELITYCRERCIDIIPEIPSLSHSEYFLMSHPELRECDDEPFASTACPSNPALYDLVFDLFDETIEVFNPSVIHIGHDEWWVMCVCDRCKDKEAGQLYAYNVNKLYDYLKARGVKTMMWADKLSLVKDKSGEVHGAAEKHVYNIKTDTTLNIMGQEYPTYRRKWFDASEEEKKDGYHHIIHNTESCFDLIPDDVILVNWYYSLDPQIIDRFVQAGRHVLFGNCAPSCLNNYRQRFAAGYRGFSVSNWVDSDRFGMQRWNTIYNLGYGAAIAWGHHRQEWEHRKNMKDVFAELFRFWNQKTVDSAHLQVVHTIAKPWDVGEQYYSKLPHYDEEVLTVGAYRVTYADGTQEDLPVVYSQNVGAKWARTERTASAASWAYAGDSHLTTVASSCDVDLREDGVWYKTVYPLRGKIASCIYVPKEGLEEYILVDSMTVVND